MRSHSKALFAVAALFAFFGLASLASASQKRLQENVFGGFSNPGSVAIDQSGGDVYVVDNGDQTIKRFDSSGNPVAFSALSGQNVINGSDAGPDADQTPANGFSFDSSSQVAIDSSGGANDGNIYVADSGHNVVAVFDESGAYLEQLNGSATPQLSFEYPCGVAVDSSGSLYVSTAFGGQIDRYVPAASPVEDSDYDAQIEGLGFGPCGLAADSTGAVYLTPSVFGGSGPLTKYAAADFGTASPPGTQVTPSASAVAVNAGDDVFADEGNQISQFDSAGALINGPFGQGNLSSSRGLGVNSATDRVYASEHTEVTPPTEPPSFTSAIHVFGPFLTLPDVITGGTEGIEETTATIKASVDPDGEAITDCHFEYGTSASYGQSAVCEPNPGSGKGAVAVKADLSGLTPGKAYHFRIVASNANGESKGEDATFTTISGPEAQTLYAGQVQTTSAILAGQVDSHNQPGTTYQFEWGTSTGYGNVVPASPADAGSADGFVVHTEPISGLNPGTPYHFRIVADNANGEPEGIDHTFTTLTPAGPPSPCGNADIRQLQRVDLPDCRAYEKVSPADKGALSVNRSFGARAISADGRRAEFYATNAPADTQSNPGSILFQFSARDPEARWHTKSIVPPRNPPSEITTGTITGFSEDLTHSTVISAKVLAPGGVQSKLNLYLRDNDDDSYQTISTQAAPPGTELNAVGISSDSSATALMAQAPQTADPGIPPDFIYPYIWHDGVVHLAGMLPNGEVPPFGAIVGSNKGFGNFVRAFSQDGKRLIFHTREFAEDPDGKASAAGQLYVRTDDGVNPASTVHVSASQRSIPDPAGPLPALYWSAETEHGSKVLFTSCEKLTDDSTAEATGFGCNIRTESALDVVALGGRDLYLFDVESGDLTDLTSADPSGSGFMGVVGASDDLDSVYFVAGGVLDEGALPDRPNLYLWRNGQVHFIVTLSDQDKANWSPYLRAESGGRNRQRVSRISAGGGYALVTSRLPLSGYDNTTASGSCGKSENGSVVFPGNCQEVFRYSVSSEELSCISCPPDGVDPAGDASLFREFGSLDIANELPRNLSSDGRVFFQTPAPLVFTDTNGKQDVYEWNEGKISLISGGQSPQDAYFFDATPSGSDVLFRTFAPLLDEDLDTIADVYDARIEGGFPEPIPNPACEGDACLTPPVVPNTQTPASSSFQGPGSPKPRKARKKHHKKRHKAKSRKHASKKSEKSRANKTRRASR